MAHRNLQLDKIVETIGTLRQRISERFPESGLARVCGDLYEIARNPENKSEWFGQPVRWLRASAGVLAV